MTGFGAQRKHAMSPTDFRLLPQNGHSCYAIGRQHLPRSRPSRRQERSAELDGVPTFATAVGERLEASKAAIRSFLLPGIASALTCSRPAWTRFADRVQRRNQRR